MPKLVKKEQGKINPREIHKKYLESVESDLVNQGVPVFEPEINLHINEEFLSLPPEITEVTSKELGEYLNAFTQQKIYIRTLLNRVEIEVEIAKREYVESTEKSYTRLSSGKLSETAKERLINAEEEVKPHYYSYVEWLKKRDVLLNTIASIEDAIFLLSREVTRRNADFDNENRSYNA